MITFDNLNENQRRAVAWDQGPLLVLAGPGSGKTGVLTLRVARLLEENESASVLALTFTNKAATEMRERVDDLLGERADRAQLCTFHSFATDVLSQHGSHLGIRSDFRHVVRDEDRLAILEDVIDELDDDLPRDRKGLLQLIDRLFAEAYAGEGESSSLAATPAWLPPLYRRYCDALIEANRLDFGSLLSLAARLLTDKPTVARVARLAWTHICVDEFQDTNRAQYELLRLIAPARNHNLFVVADDDQIIYQWNGASPERLQDLRRDYDLDTAQLPESYRCPPAIVSLANRLIAHNTRRIAERSIRAVHDPQQAYAEEVRYDVFASPRDEAEFVGRDIRERGLTPSDCVVLGRTKRLVQDAADGLLSAGHDAYVPVKKGEFDSPAVNVLVEALRSANSPHDRVVLRRLCLAWEGLTRVVVDPQSVEAAAALVGGHYLRAWVRSAEAVTEGWEPVLKRIRTDIVDALRFPGVVDWFLAGGWESWEQDDPEESTGEEIATWRDLHGEIVAEYGAGVALNSYLQQLDLASKTPPPAPGALRCMNVHQAKGLEFRHVYLIGMAQEVFPSIYALREGAGSRQVEEERRSCFVAVTRARDTLTLTRSRNYYGYSKDPSQFLAEMGVASRG